jgi:hypothetical protein
MLGFIAQYIPHFLTNDIVKRCTSLDGVWQKVRKYYGFKNSESQFMKYSSIVLEENERPERLIAHLQDNLLTTESPLTHDGEKVTKNEEISPTVERLVVLHWMELINPGLPALVQRTFAFDLQKMSLKDLQPQICVAMDGFLEELRHEDVKVSRAWVKGYGHKAGQGSTVAPYARHSPAPYSRQPAPYSRQPAGTSSARQSYKPVNTPSRNSRPLPTGAKVDCRVCRAEGRQYTNHSIAECDYLSNVEKRGFSCRSSHVDTEQLDQDIDSTHEDLETCTLQDNSESP